MLNNENENEQLGYQNFNQKFLCNGGVAIYFGNVFLPAENGKLPMLKSKLRQVLVDFGLSKTYAEINQELGCIKVLYQDFQSTELKGLLLQRFNDLNRESQAVEIDIAIEGYFVPSPKSSGQVRTYNGLTDLLYREFIIEPQVFSLSDSSVMEFYEQMRKTIQKGNLAPPVPLESIFRGEVDLNGRLRPKTL